MERELARLGIPREAVNIEVDPPLELASHTLRDKYRPVQGGFQIQAYGRGACSLGFNARDSASRRLFVTASHCSNVMGEVESNFYQPSYAIDTFIGYEYRDPPFWTGLPCPSGRRCRWSDSLLARFGTAVADDLGRIARTTGLGSITVDHSKPTFRITSETARPAAGQVLNKVGKGTGWSQGAVDRVCVDANFGGTDITFLCQDHVAAHVGGGDSGAPVFKLMWRGDVSLYGVLWAMDRLGFWFSAFYNVQIELGTLKTCAPGFTC